MLQWLKEKLTLSRNEEPTAEFTLQESLWLLGSLAQVHSLAFDTNLTAGALTESNTVKVLQPIAKDLGLGLESSKVSKLLMANASGVAVILLKSQAEENLSAECAQEGPAAVEHWTPAIVLRRQEGQVLFVRCGQPQPEALPLEQLAALCAGTGWRVKPLVKEAKLPDQLKTESFGFKWFIEALAEHRKLWVDVLGASLVIQLISLCLPLMTQAIIDKVVVNHAQSTLISLAIGLAIFQVFSAMLSWIRQYVILKLGNAVDGDLAIKVFGHLIRLPMRYFQYRPTGTLITRVHGVETIRNFLTGAFMTLVLDMPFLLIFLVVMFYYSVTLSLVTLAFVGVMVSLSFVIAPKLRERANKQYLVGAQNQAFLTEYIAGMEAVKSLQMEPRVEAQFSLRMQQYLDTTLTTRQLYNHYSTLMSFLEQMMSLFVVGAGAWLSMTDSNFTLGMLVAFQMFSNRVSQPLLKISGLWQEFQQTQIAVKRLGDVMDVPAETFSVVPTSANERKGLVEIKHLSFGYDKNRPPLYTDLNLTIEPGKVVTLLGPSGSGKSTIAKLLQGFYPDYQGQILLDGRDMRAMPLNAVRQYFGVVPQETVLFSGTIYDNLIAANPQANLEMVVQACKMANIHSTIENLEKGYQTEIGERGAGLSGGQKQRIAIARALLKRPKVLIFDEATSALDPESAEAIGQTISTLRGHVSVLFVSHNLPKSLLVDARVNLNDSLY